MNQPDFFFIKTVETFTKSKQLSSVYQDLRNLIRGMQILADWNSFIACLFLG